MHGTYHGIAGADQNEPHLWFLDTKQCCRVVLLKQVKCVALQVVTQFTGTKLNLTGRLEDWKSGR